MKRLGVIGDIHGEDVALALVLDHLHTLDVDLVLATGDVVDGPGDVARCLEILDEHEVQWVLGNHEQWYLQNVMRHLPQATLFEELSLDTRRSMAALPLVRRFDTPAGPAILCHGCRP